MNPRNAELLDGVKEVAMFLAFLPVMAIAFALSLGILTSIVHWLSITVG